MSFAVKKVLSGLARLFRWTLWLVLAAALALQLRILSDGGLRLPAFAIEAISKRLATRGLSFRAEAVWLDPRGRVLIIAPRAGLAPASGTPVEFASAHAVALRLRRRELLRGELRFTRVEITGLALSLPALHSPTGADQPLLESGEFLLALDPGSPDWRLEQSSARVLSIPTAFTGAIPPSSDAPPRSLGATTALTHQIFRRAAALYRELATLPLDSIRSLRVTLAPPDLSVSFELPRLVLTPHPTLPAVFEGGSLEDLRATVILPLDAFSRSTLELGELRLHASTLSLPAPLALAGQNLDLRLAARGRTLRLGRVADLEIEASAALSDLTKTDALIPPVPLVADARYIPASSRLSLALSTRLADAPWSASFAGDPAARAGDLSASGEITPALLELVRPYLPEKARPILTIADPVSLTLEATFADRGAPVRVAARGFAGRAVAHDVIFDRAAASLLYEPGEHRLRADDLLVVNGDSRATGSYEMDTRTLAFRFLVGGRIRPMIIGGWFSGWWDRLWDDFTFGPSPPDAEVDVRGVWGLADGTTVFVGASSGPMRLRGLELDTLDTRVHVHAGAVELLGFRATRDDHAASGSLARFIDGENDQWSRLSFDIRSDFPLDALPALFPEEGAEIAAPFRLTTPPRIHLIGEAFGPASPTPGVQRYTLDLASPGPLRYEGFPLDHLSTRLEREGDEIRLLDLHAGFADGLAVGRATLSGPASDRWLAFDLALAESSLDLVLLRWREFKAASEEQGAGSLAPSAPPSASLPAPKPLGGTLALSLSATGPVARPLGFSGLGSALIHNADLAQIQLLGGLSAILSDVGIGLATVKLTDATARFTLAQNRLLFESLQLTGPSALVEADGAYLLPEGALDFSAKIRPFEQRSGILSSTADFVFSPLSSALEVELAGTLDEPDWTFTYGPTRLFRRITGSRPKSSSTAPTETR